MTRKGSGYAWPVLSRLFLRAPSVRPGSPASRFHRVRRIGTGRPYVPRRPVDRRHLLPRQPQPGLDLGAVVAGVEDAPPEDPESLPIQAAEERPLLQPTGRRSVGEL